ncbi:(2Fe-2S) ferredoxin domain-containing protein [Oscillatoria sp. CS-180]|uniref:(2Fe-2S) ferredoxin domain-containing protein n=1 Tax=Oscillatoria sp. CS-180 TaxID=3021720 RepID=UPI00232EF4D1|nr:(2Fe-2S) ferredoxin domain-containing protein [Oscillatoria sp. CS-180]MDB9525444.1 (2Fe-2S) ferredoxin domain-containing protein [Oscillatoria sp. CS-180]
MLDITSMPQRMFKLEGTFQGFLGDNFKKPKFIILEVEQEQVVIKLPKELRPYARSTLNVGDRLYCVGRSQVDLQAGVVKLRAHQVFFLTPSEMSETPVSATVEAAARIAQEQHACHAPKRQRSKILVCNKSGCQKRGGREMIAELEQVLQAYQLEDQVEIRHTRCQKRCSKAPNLTVMPGKHCYEKINPKDLSALVEEHFCQSTS